MRNYYGGGIIICKPLQKSYNNPSQAFFNEEKFMAEETIFTKIINGTIPSTLVYHDDLVSAFCDIAPKAKHHILIVTNKPIPSVNEATLEDEAALGRLFTAARKIASDLGIDKSGYRLIVNTGADGGQEVPHLHMHLLGGQKMGPLGFTKE